MSRLNSESINVLQILKDSSAEKIVQIFKSVRQYIFNFIMLHYQMFIYSNPVK